MNCALRTAQISYSKRDKTFQKGDDLKKYYDCDPIFQTRLVMSKRNTGYTSLIFKISNRKVDHNLACN